MTGHTKSGEAILERIQISVLPNSPKAAPMTNAVLTTPQKDGDAAGLPRRTTEERERDLSNTQVVWTSLLAGAAAGALAKTTIAPLDRTKINFQISKRPYSVNAAIEFLVKSYKAEGLLSLWRGNSATMVRIVPYAAIQFTAYEQWKRFLGVDDPSTTTSGRRFLAGALAGVTSQGMTYPLDLVRARMAVTQKTEYKTLRHVFAHIYKYEGLLAFYRGFHATILGVIPYAGCSFFTYGTLKNLLAEYTEYTGRIPGMSTFATLLCGAVAGMVGQTSSYPLDIVRRRMQTAAIKGHRYHTILSTALQIYTEEGMMAFFKGLSMNWVKGPVATGVSFATYDRICDILRTILKC